VTVASDDLIAFLRSQWDAEEADARWSLENAPAAHQTDPNSMNFSPARVLAEVEAKRRILDEYAEASTYYGQNRAAPAGELHGLLTAVKLLALPYADVDGYHEEWRP
jgi:hypothetical protein